MMMNLKSTSFAALSLMLSVVAAHAQQLPQRVRLTTADSAGERQWTGHLERLMRDSVELRLTGPDTIVVFSRATIRLAERQTTRVSKGRAATVGCVIGGAALGAVGFSGPDNSGDYSGIRKVTGVIGIVVGCPAGALIAVLVSRGQKWEPWLLPD
jgi:hypothetical protein